MKYFLIISVFFLAVACSESEEGGPPCTSCGTSPTGKVRFVAVGDSTYIVKVGTSGPPYTIKKPTTGAVNPSDCASVCYHNECANLTINPGSYFYYVYHDLPGSQDSLVQTGPISIAAGSCNVIRCTQ